jgi:hypothetical protein
MTGSPRLTPRDRGSGRRGAVPQQWLWLFADNWFVLVDAVLPSDPCLNLRSGSALVDCECDLVVFIFQPVRAARDRMQRLSGIASMSCGSLMLIKVNLFASFIFSYGPRYVTVYRERALMNRNGNMLVSGLLVDVIEVLQGLASGSMLSLAEH